MEIKITKGLVVLKKPTAGARNKGLIAAETSEGVLQARMLIELLPHCITSHPFGTVPIRQALDALTIKEYDKLIEGLTEVMGASLIKKKEDSNQPSGQDEPTTQE